MRISAQTPEAVFLEPTDLTACCFSCGSAFQHPGSSDCHGKAELVTLQSARGGQQQDCSRLPGLFRGFVQQGLEFSE